MCGIAGIVKLDPSARAEESRLRAMRDTLTHRGPDDAGAVVRGVAGLAHRRLSIIDLAGGHQPMSNPDGTTWLTYNGELYNFRELRTQLQDRGFGFSTASDSEVVLRAWDAFGEDCVDHLSGMFAFAVWDTTEQRLFLARDRLGIKPLYYAIDDDELLFASEIKAILAVRRGRPAFNRAVLPEFLASRYVADGETFFEGIRKLLPGHVLTWTRSSGIRQRRYWSPPAADDVERPYRETVDSVRQGLEDAVRRHLVSDVPVGLFLSGGLDSTVLAALMARQRDEPVHSFSVGFQETSANELDYARLAAREIGTVHQDIVVSPEQFFAELPRLIWHEDEPIAFTSSIPLNLVSRLAREHVKVVLTGEGADELFIGYDYRYRITDKNLRWGDRYRRLTPSPIRRLVRSAVPHLPGAARRYAERSFLALDWGPRDMFFENFSVFRPPLRGSLLRDPDLERQRQVHQYGLRKYAAGGADAISRMSHADLQTYLVELLMKQDQMSMAASLESRVPFLDHHLVEQVAAIPGHVRMRDGRTKSLLRDAVADIVPPAIMNRSKMGFPVPVGEWLRGPFWRLVDEFVLSTRARERGLFNPACLMRIALEHRAGQADYAEQLWLLINLEIWQRIFLEGEEPARVYRCEPPRLPPAPAELPEALVAAQ